MKLLNKASKVHNLLLTSGRDLVLSDRRLYNYLLHHAYNALDKKLEFKIALTQLEGVYGTGLPSIDRLKESIRRLMRTLVEFKVPGGDWAITSLLEKAALNEKQSYLYYSYSLSCRHLLTDPLTLERCLIQAHFTHKYSHLLYEILNETLFLKQNVLSVEISDLRSRLQIDDNKLTNFCDLKRFVLVPAMNEINSYASFAVKFHTKRKGMKVIRVLFEITIKKDLLTIENGKQMIPPKRPRLFIDDPELERAYSFILNAETKDRRKYFDLAVKKAAKKKKTIAEEQFDQPDRWFKWIVDDIKMI